MCLRSGDILSVESTIKTDGGINALHDFRRSGGIASAPHGIAAHNGVPGELELFKSRYLFFAFAAVLAMFPVLFLQTALADKGPPRTGWMKQFTVIDKLVPAPRVPLSNGEGLPVFLSDFEGKVVLVNFWATWCAPCVQEMPGIDRLQAKLGGKDFTVVVVNEDRGGFARAKPFLEKLGTTHLVLYVDSKMAMMRAFKVRGLPTSFLLDRQGRIVGKLEGIAEWDTPEVEDLIRYYTKQTTSAKTSRGPAISG